MIGFFDLIFKRPYLKDMEDLISPIIISKTVFKVNFGLNKDQICQTKGTKTSRKNQQKMKIQLKSFLI